MDAEFGNRVMNAAVQAGSDPAELQKHLDGLSPAHQDEFVQEMAGHLGIGFSPDNAPTQNESMAIGAASQVPFQPEISGAIEKGIGQATDLLRSPDTQLYQNAPVAQLAQENRQVTAEAQKENPDAFTLGQTGANMVLSALPAAGAAKATGLAKTALNVLANPEVQGAVIGASEGGPGNRLSGGMQGIFGAAVLHGAMKLASLGNELKAFANSKSAQMVHLSSGDTKRLKYEGVQKLGDMLLNEKVTNEPTNLLLIRDKTEAIRKTTGEALGTVAQTVEERLGPQPLMTRAELAADLESALKTPTAATVQGSERFHSTDAANDAMKEASDFLGQLGKTADDKVGFNDMWELAQKFDEVSNTHNRSTMPIDQSRADMLDRMSDRVRGLLQNYADSVGVGDTWAATSEKYSLMKRAARASDEALAIKTGRNMGDGLPKNVTSKIVDSTLGGARAQGAQAGTANLVSKLLRAGKSLGKYDAVLQKAARQSASAAGARHFVLMQTDPDYRERALKVLSKENPSE